MIVFILLAVIIASIVFEKQMLSLIAILTGSKTVLHEAGSLCDSVPPPVPDRVTKKEFPVQKWRIENGIWIREI